MIVKGILAACIGYLAGSVSMSVIVSGLLFRDDVRKYGSGNAGATNMARTFGMGPGILTFLCDFGKCALAMFAGQKLLGDTGCALAGIFCMIGHCYPVFFGFKGGKAVSTGACVAFFISPPAGFAMVGVFVLVVLLSKIVSISSITAALLFIITCLFLKITLPMRILGIFMGVLVIFRHKENIRRLLKGEETKFIPASGKGKKRNG